MKKFIVTYHASASAMQQMANTTPEDAKKGMELWQQWAAKCGDHLVDMGAPLTAGQKLIPGGNSAVSNREVCGYSILQANDMDHAKELLQGHPHLGWDGACEIEVHESMPLPV
jgi:hypothetical protein